MTFDFFNTSSLAFGKNLTAAFKNLHSQFASAAETFHNSVLAAKYSDYYVDRNYQVPEPTAPDKPCRVGTLLEILKGAYPIGEISISGANLTINSFIYTTANERITNGTGSTTISKGYSYLPLSNTNTRLSRNIVFSEYKMDGTSELELFKYEVVSSSVLKVSNINSELKFM